MKNIAILKTFLESFSIIIGMSAIGVITFYLITGFNVCIILFEPNKFIRLTEIIMSIFAFGFLLKILKDKFNKMIEYF